MSRVPECLCSLNEFRDGLDIVTPDPDTQPVTMTFVNVLARSPSRQVRIYRCPECEATVAIERGVA
jgi:hypothetical protein